VVIRDGLADLRDHLVGVPDARARRGVRHAFASILALAAAAGARLLTAIEEWAGDAPQRVLAALGVRRCRRRDRHVAPDAATIRGVLGQVDGDALDAAITGWVLATTTDGPAVIAVDTNGHTADGVTSLAPHQADPTHIPRVLPPAAPTSPRD